METLLVDTPDDPVRSNSSVLPDYGSVSGTGFDPESLTF